MGNLSSILNASVGLYIIIVIIALAIPFLGVYFTFNKNHSEADPYLALKTILALLFSVGLQISSLGIGIFIASQLTDGGFAGYRLGLGLSLGGLITATLPYVGTFALNQKSAHPNLWQAILAINGTLFGLAFIVMGTNTCLNVLTTGLSKISLSFTFLYLLGSLICLISYARMIGANLEEPSQENPK
jgi:hypothetical protein